MIFTNNISQRVVTKKQLTIGTKREEKTIKAY